ncbi:MAG: cytochrome c [Sphingomonadales bacterium]
MKGFHQLAIALVGLSILAFTGPLVVLASGGSTSLENGKAVYGTTCIACHGAKGKGEIPGVPDFTKKKSPLSKSDAELFQNLLNGFQSPGSFMEMPIKGGNPDLTEQDIQDVILYLREEFEKK